MDEKRLINRKLLRCGYTTGSCAAAASKAAALILLTGHEVPQINIETPRGIPLTLDVLEISRTEDSVKCAVRKDSGDDPDITNGILVFAESRKIAFGIEIEGGEGIGRVTKKGLDRPVGDAAINTVPRRMITEAIQSAICETSYNGGISVLISIPDGERIAKKTFNPRLGIEGGLSILGTSGIVEPMSDKALSDSIRLEASVIASQGKREILITLGNYGEDFAENELMLSLDSHIKCSNFIGDAIDSAVENGFEKILIIGHLGKLSKLGLGMMNTHSSCGDGRIECLIACALAVGANTATLREISACVTTDAALEILENAGLLSDTMSELGQRIEYYVNRRVPDSAQIGFICFTNEPKPRILTESKNAVKLLEIWRQS
ncbi:MAG: cobalamin biosynthesis protein CbiD [Clostridiales bacterium]|nr:cobalamin biosynthesis protein CbiD [Clostridiales bacterium]